MEDISRDLEKEIAASTKHVPVRRKIKSGYFLINDLGEIKSASWLRGLAWFFAFTAIVSTALAFVFYYMYMENRTERIRLTGNLTAAEKRISSLTNEKEILMARVIISGKSLPHGLPEGGEKSSVKSVSAVKAENIPHNEKTSAESGKNRIVHALKENKTNLIRSKDKNGTDLIKKKINLAEKDMKIEKILKSNPVKQGSNSRSRYSENTKYEKIGVEDFKLLKDEKTDDLLMRFNIRNVSEKAGNISGRIFVILKPDSNPSNWLVVPGVSIKDGKPVNPKRGQYFSIAHFKAVNFRIKNTAALDSFKKASVFIYDKDKLIYMREIDILLGHGR